MSKAGEQSRVLVRNKAAAGPRELAWDPCPTRVLAEYPLLLMDPGGMKEALWPVQKVHWSVCSLSPASKTHPRVFWGTP